VEEVADLPFVEKTALRTVAPDGRTIRLPPAAVSTSHLDALGGTLPFAPRYGEHTDALLCEVGVGPEEITVLRDNGVVA
jgi:crotonobetainyl-CoA:carnitine CoA-transferase CaiB-like acyl-CoA transferase